MRKPTPQQSAIIDFAKDFPDTALVVEALAGTGKTTTIVDLLARLTRSPNLILAFNKSIQRELATRIPASMQFDNSIATVHSFGLGALKSAGYRKTKIDGGKLHFLFRRILDGKASFSRHFNDRRAGASDIVRLVSCAKNSGFGLGAGFPGIHNEDHWFDLLEHFRIDEALEDNSIPLPAAIEMAQRLLLESNRTEAMIDFDDMVYLPLLLNLPIQQFRNVIIDEAQDISATRLELAARACRDGGRLIAVGDRHQAIYGFTGADAHALDNIISRFNAHILPLSVCFRCDEAIIQAAQQLVPAITARPGATPGEVHTIDIDELLNHKPADLLGSAILCRLNRPNVALALELIRKGIPAKIEGRDLGKSILRHIQKANPLYATLPLEELLSPLADYATVETGRLLAKNRKSAAAYLSDEIDAGFLLIERALEQNLPGWVGLEALTQSLFGDDLPSKNIVTLSSIHKAKGREWPKVFILDQKSWMPFFLAEADWEMTQEQNLIYVAYTRAERCLVHVNGVKAWLDERANTPTAEVALAPLPR